MLVFGLTAWGGDSRGDDEGFIYFENKVRPLLVEHCYECHSGAAKKLKANLYLDSREGWRIGGDSGPAVIPGKPDESLLYQSVSHSNSELKMPPKTRLSDDEVVILHRWITMGAPDPREGEVNQFGSEIDLEKGREFWAFKPPVSPTVPAIGDSSWPRTSLDHFILARLEAKGIEPALDAPRRALLRRIYYDLIGLPPSPEEMAHFLADLSPTAFETVVDDLLGRPEFGERWGRHWLDVSRFAESSGGGRSLIFANAWRFRDYVIDSFNNDKPYDQFVREQLAGDVLPWQTVEQRNVQLTGSGYLVLGPINYELQDKELLRMEFVDEQIDALGRTFLGMTLGCARCHDHKFDPIPTTDYYAMAGIFQSTESMGEGSAAAGVASFATVKLEGPQTNELKKLHQDLAKVSRRLKQGEKQKSSKDIAEIPGVVVDSSLAKITGDWKHSVFTGSWVGDGYIHDQGQGKGDKQVVFSASLSESIDYEVLVSYAAGPNRSRQTPVTIRHAKGESLVNIDQTKTPDQHGCFVSVGTFSFSNQTPARVIISNKGTSGVVIADAVSFISPGQMLKKEEINIGKEASFDLKALEKQRKSIEAGIKKLEPVTMAVSESKTPKDGRVHIRGQVRNKGPAVPRGFISVAMKQGAVVDIADGSSGRLELANWIADSENPITSRVMVNRVWKYLLGEGIVRTTDNFGKTGELPSHPELLDYLSLRFVNHNWSVKKLIREIVLSRTYQLASSRYHKLDPENSLFGRANRKRLEAECIRDTVLLVSGQLDSTRGGLTIQKPGKYDLNYQFNSVKRSVYVPWFRNSILDIFEVFDVANPNLVTGKRTTTNLPTQALYLMNSEFITDHSRLTAQRLIKEGATIDRATTLLLGRPATESEQLSLTDFLYRFPPEQQEDAWTQICQTLFSCIDFRFLD